MTASDHTPNNPAHPDNTQPGATPSISPTPNKSAQPDNPQLPAGPPLSSRSLNRQILALALPAFGALIAEPLFILADTGIVGHLGTPQLAGLSVASQVVMTVIGLMIFLSYSTTPAVATLFGRGDLAGAYRKGRDGLWVGFIVGVALAVTGVYAARPLLAAMGAEGATLDSAVDYFRWSMPGLPGMLVVLAALGVLRGLQDTRTPLYVATGGALLNVVVNWVLVYPVGMGISGSALGTSLVQWLMAAVYLVLIVRGARRHGVVMMRTTFAGLGSILSVGSWLMLRTLCMRVALLATVFVVTQQGPVHLAGYQLTMSLFSFMAFGLDALAIAAQAMLGKEMGARDLCVPVERDGVRHLMHRLIRWSVGFGVITGVACPVAGFFLSPLLTDDPSVQHLFAVAMIVVGLAQPLASYVFILDGVLIGAQDFRYLAVASCIALVGYAPMLGAVHLLSQAGLGVDVEGFVWLWVAYAFGFMGLRGLTLGLRSRQGVWIRAGKV